MVNKLFSTELKPIITPHIKHNPTIVACANWIKPMRGGQITTASLIETDILSNIDDAILYLKNLGWKI